MFKAAIAQTKPILRKLKSFFTVDKFSKLYALSDHQDQENKINIVYVMHVDGNLKTGGDKVIYKQSELINQMGLKNVRSQILHGENTDFQHQWFEHNVSFKKDTKLNPKTDFVILPEIMVVPHARLLIKLGIRYGIYVQNGYSVSIPLFVSDYDALKEAYQHAEIILSISDDTSDCLKLIFPDMASKVQRVFYSVNVDTFKPDAEKENLITYMPRKLARHANLVKFFLQDNLPQGWKLQPIHGLSENGVAALLAKSKIFLSFSEFEGCPLPPVEAALSGNVVVGYTGEGAKEYWQPPIFSEVHCGDIRAYVKEVLSKISALESGQLTQEFAKTREYLANRYSKEAEVRSIDTFIQQVESLMAR